METKEKADSYSSILKYTALFGGVQGLAIVVGLVRNKIVAVLLGPDGMGLQALFNSTIKFVGDSTNMGISMSAVKYLSSELSSREESRIGNAVKVIRSWSFLAALIGFFVCIVLSPLLNRWTFSWGDHTFHFILLSPVVALTAITAGETAILKGTRQLKHLASISIGNIIGTLILTVPLYYFFGQAGIVPAIFVTALLQMTLTTIYSWHRFPLHVSLKKRVLRKGQSMIVLGWAFVLAGILGSGADFLIRSVMNSCGSLGDVGMFNSAYMLVMTYGGMVFAAMETDFFPRLSGVRQCGSDFNNIVNRQMEVSVLLISPLLAVLITMLPILVPLLFSQKFMPMIPLAQVLVAAMYLRALRLPMSYIPLSRGEARSYLLMEGIYDVVEVVTVIFAYLVFGLQATAFALVLTAVIDFFVLFFYMRHRYGYIMSRPVMKYSAVQFAIGFALYMLMFFAGSLIYWTVGALLCVLSIVVSLHVLHSKTGLWASLVRRFKKLIPWLK
jgi:O-antigen/teichoic acid export membrane protein